MLEIGEGVADVCNVTMAQSPPSCYLEERLWHLNKDFSIASAETRYVFASRPISRGVVGFPAVDS